MDFPFSSFLLSSLPFVWLVTPLTWTCPIGLVLESDSFFFSIVWPWILLSPSSVFVSLSLLSHSASSSFYCTFIRTKVHVCFSAASPSPFPLSGQPDPFIAPLSWVARSWSPEFALLEPFDVFLPLWLRETRFCLHFALFSLV